MGVLGLSIFAKVDAPLAVRPQYQLGTEETIRSPQIKVVVERNAFGGAALGHLARRFSPGGVGASHAVDGSA